MDRIFISDLRVDTVVGIYAWERRVRQTVALDIELATNVAKAAATDDIRAATDYKAICKRLIEFIRAARYQLVETLAERCARLVLEEFAVSWVRIKLNKPGALRGARGVGVVIERGHEQGHA